ncbi:MAG TPA: cysteine desulfurase family protein [bacterium]|nr:cysteine desulfurase family protein [bacterium]
MTHAPTEIYLDNAATTKPHPAVVEAVTRALVTDYGNPSSLHGKGVAAERLLTSARDAVARTLGVDLEAIVFTSGGTEANNLAIHGTLAHTRGRHVVTTTVEHSSVGTPLQTLAERGWSVTALPVDRSGRVSLSELETALRPDTALVSVMAVNNELGTIQPIEEIGRVVRQHNANGGRAVFHVDAVQAWGKIPLHPVAWGVDLMSLSAHKIHGPKGVGVLYVRRGVQLTPRQVGGEQEGGVRPGTENAPGIAGLGAAAQLLSAGAEANLKVRELSDRLRSGIESLSDARINTDRNASVPHTLSATFRGVRGEMLLHRLSQDGVLVSTGSACHSQSVTPSHVLLAIGLSDTDAKSTIRFSLSRFTTASEIDTTIRVLGTAVSELRALVR